MKQRSCNMMMCHIMFCLVVALSSCDQRINENVLEQIVLMQNPTAHGKPISSETVAQVKQALMKYEKNIKDTVKASGQLGAYYRLLAKQYVEIEELKQEIALLKAAENEKITAARAQKDTLFQSILILEYVDQQMYVNALEEIKAARKIYPESPTLYYYAGLCSAKLGKSQVAADEQDAQARYYADAITYYGRAIELDPGYVDALKGLAVVYIFELGTPALAEKHLNAILEKEKNNTDAKFLLARVYAANGNLSGAMKMYDDIVSTAKSDLMKNEAKRNSDAIRQMLKGGTR